MAKTKKQTPVLKAKVGKLEINDYEDISTLVGKKMKEYKQFSAQWSGWATIKQKIEKKIQQMHKREMNAAIGGSKTKEKEFIRWKCLDCDEIHDKAEQILRCPKCKSENIEKMTKYMEKEIAAAGGKV